MVHNEFPLANSEEEFNVYEQLKQNFVHQFHEVFPDRQKWQTVVVVPSGTLEINILEKIEGVQHYEERMLFMLMLLRQPRTRVVYVTSQAIDPAIIDYYLHLLPGVPSRHAKRRLTFISCHDSSPTPLTQKILGRRLMINRIREAIDDPATTHLACYNVTPLERTLAVRLGVPLYGCDPALWHLGGKSGGRQLFREVGVQTPDGREDLNNEQNIIDALVALKQSHPNLNRVAIKQNDGVSGRGNAVFSFEGCPQENLKAWVTQELPLRVQPEAEDQSWNEFLSGFETGGGAVECWIEGDEVRSPSVQGLITPIGDVEIVSTHDQVLGGASGQIYMGCTFPAAEPYRLEIQQAGLRVGQKLAEQGVWGRFAVDFISVKTDTSWDTNAIEINVRRGGTTHPYLMLQFLIDGRYDLESGLYLTPNGQPRYYYASDTIEKDIYRGLIPDDLINILVENNLSFHTAEQRGVVFHLIGALSEFGKMGALCVDDSPEKAEALYHKTISILDAEAEKWAL